MAAPQKSVGSISEVDAATVSHTAQIEFGQDTCGSLEIGELKEWLVTNAIRGYASGTVSGNLTRRYHGLLLAALKPPVGLTQLVAKLDETVRFDGAEYPLSTNRWASGAVQPEGDLNIESFRLEGTIPVWHFAFGDALLQKRIWMEQGENTTYVRYTLLRATGPVQLEWKALLNYRDFHSSTHAGNWQMQIEPVEHGARIVAFEGATPFYADPRRRMLAAPPMAPQLLFAERDLARLGQSRGPSSRGSLQQTTPPDPECHLRIDNKRKTGA